MCSCNAGCHLPCLVWQALPTGEIRRARGTTPTLCKLESGRIDTSCCEFNLRCRTLRNCVPDAVLESLDGFLNFRSRGTSSSEPRLLQQFGQIHEPSSVIHSFPFSYNSCPSSAFIAVFEGKLDLRLVFYSKQCYLVGFVKRLCEAWDSFMSFCEAGMT